MKFIFASDLHLRPDRPIARRDPDWLKTQYIQLMFVKENMMKYDCPLIIGGDLHHRYSVPDSIKNIFINVFFNMTIYAITGQHDLKEHNFEQLNKTSFGVLLSSGVISFPKNCSFQNFGREIVVDGKESILFLHDLIFEDEKNIPPNVRAKTASEVLKEYPDYKWIICGDQHHGFHYKEKGRHLIMGGCFNRQSAKFIDYEPVIWFIDTDNNIVERISVPDDVNLIGNEHIINKKDREDRLSAFVSLVQGKKSVTLDFEENIRNGLAENSVLSQGAVEIINELMGV